MRWSERGVAPRGRGDAVKRPHRRVGVALREIEARLREVERTTDELRHLLHEIKRMAVAKGNARDIWEKAARAERLLRR